MQFEMRRMAEYFDEALIDEIKRLLSIFQSYQKRNSENVRVFLRTQPGHAPWTGSTCLLTFNGGDFKRFTEITVVNPRDVT